MPEWTPAHRIRNLLFTAAKGILIGFLFAFVLEGADALRYCIAGLSGVAAVWCCVAACRLWLAAKPPAPGDVEPYSALQQSMRRTRDRDTGGPGAAPPSSPSDPL